jgi:hypothetical protein
MVNKFGYSAEVTGGRKKVNTNLSIISFIDENKVFVVFAPALRMYGYGKNFSEAMESFNIHLLEFINYTTNKNTLHAEMKKLGWVIKKRKDTVNYKVPEMSTLLSENKELSDIINNRDAKIIQRQVAIPV